MKRLVLKVIGTVHSIKPYAPELDCFEVRRAGWLQKKGGNAVLADGRFERRKPV